MHTDGTVRLTHDIYFGYEGYGQLGKPFGRLEVYMDGEWGTVCSRGGFGDNEANVACRAIGFPGSEYHGLSSEFM